MPLDGVGSISRIFALAVGLRSGSLLLGFVPLPNLLKTVLCRSFDTRIETQQIDRHLKPLSFKALNRQNSAKRQSSGVSFSRPADCE